MAYNFKNWNAIDAHQIESGSVVPVLVVPCNKRVGGAKVLGVSAGQRVPAGTPFYYNIQDRTATFYEETTEQLPTAALTQQTVGSALVGTVYEEVASTAQGAVKCAIDADTLVYLAATAATGNAVAGKAYYTKDTSNKTTAYIKNVTPNAISIADCIGGNVATTIDVPYGIVYMYKNTIASDALTERAIKAIKEAGDVIIVWENYNETNS